MVLVFNDWPRKTMLQNGNSNYLRARDLVKLKQNNKLAIVQPVLNNGISYTDNVLIKIVDQKLVKSIDSSNIQFVSNQSGYTFKNKKIKINKSK